MKLADRCFAFASFLLSAALCGVANIFLRAAVRDLHAKLKRVIQQHEPPPHWAAYAPVLVRAEDHRFYLHCGVDCVAISRAVVQTHVYRNRQGASTIEQQLLRTLTGDYRRSYRRKLREVFLAATLSHEFSKHEILIAYLSVAHFGAGLSGIAKAIEGIDVPEDFAGHEEAYIISHLKYPRLRKNDERQSRLRLKRALHIAKLCKLRPITTFVRDASQ